jgi:hypothetical protein
VLINASGARCPAALAAAGSYPAALRAHCPITKETPDMLTLAHLETAATIWEAVLDLKASVPVDGATRTTGEEIGAHIARICTDHGTAELRSTVIGWTERLEADWQAADTCNGKYPLGGQYGEAFDWEFVPAWLIDKVDWTGPDMPSLLTFQPVAPVDIAQDLATALEALVLAVSDPARDGPDDAADAAAQSALVEAEKTAGVLLARMGITIDRG